MVAGGRSQELSELSAVIGELRNFAAQQTATNQHVLEQLKSISDRINSIGETGIVLQEYRNTLHERFGKIHEHLGTVDIQLDRNTEQLQKLSTVQAAWQSNIKIIISTTFVAGTIASALISNFGGVIIRQLVNTH